MRSFPLSFTCPAAGAAKVTDRVCVLEWHTLTTPKHAFLYRVMNTCYRPCHFTVSVFCPRRESPTCAIPASPPWDSPEGRKDMMQSWQPDCPLLEQAPGRVLPLAWCRHSPGLWPGCCFVALFIAVLKSKKYLLNTRRYTLRFEARVPNRKSSYDYYSSSLHGEKSELFHTDTVKGISCGD